MDKIIKKLNVNLIEPIIKVFSAITLPHNRLLFSYISTDKENVRFYQFEDGEWKIFESDWKIIQKKNHTTNQINRIVYLIDNRGHLQQYINIQNSNDHNLLLLDSPKYGKEWTGYRQLNQESQNWAIYGKPTLLQQGLWMGRILCPVFDRSVQRVFCLYSQDNGLNFNQGLFIEPNEDQIGDSIESSTNDEENNWEKIGTIDPILIECPNEIIKCFCRQINQQGIFVADSYDFCDTWSEIQEIPSLKHMSSHDYDIITMKRTNGELSNIILFVGIEEKQTQKHLKLFASHPSTTEFEEKLCIDANIKELYGLQLLQDESGMIHLLYSNNPKDVIHLTFSTTTLDLN